MARAKGLQNVQGMGIGGTLAVAGLDVTMVPAVHTSSVVENDTNVYLGVPAGFVVRTGGRAGVLLRGRHRRVRRHGAHRRDARARRSPFCLSATTSRWDPRAAAIAARMLGVRQIVPMHYGTFPVLTGTPERLKELVGPQGIDVLVLKPGETGQ